MMNSRKKRGSTDKAISVEEEVGRTICFRNTRTTIHFIIIFFETNPESKYKKGRKIAPTQPTKRSRSHRQPCQKIQIKKTKQEERIESGGKRVT